MSDTKLLPCPFCGFPATLQYNRVGGAHIFCSNPNAVVDCETESPTEADNDETFAAWNERIPDPRLAAAEPCPTCAARGTSSLYVPRAWVNTKLAASESLADALRAMLEPLPDHDVIEALMADAGLGYRRFPATYSDKAVTEFRAALAAWEKLK